MNNVERIRGLFARNELCLGLGVGLTDPLTSEIAADLGYDFTFIDLEHGAMTIETALAHVMAVRGSDTAPFIRVPWPDPVRIKPVIDLHPAGIIVPMVCTAEDAATAVAACKYPPKGIRGFAPCRGIRFGGMSTPEYVEHADDQTLVIVQIEHIEAVKNLDAILATQGIDTILIGPCDLSGSMGLLGQTTHPDVVATIDQIIARGRAAGLPVGLAGCPPDALVAWRAKGVAWLSLSVDWVLVHSGARALIDRARTVG